MVFSLIRWRLWAAETGFSCPASGNTSEPSPCKFKVASVPQPLKHSPPRITPASRTLAYELMALVSAECLKRQSSPTEFNKHPLLICSLFQESSAKSSECSDAAQQQM